MATQPLPDDPTLSKAYLSAIRKYLKQPGVTGVDWGYRYVNGIRTEEKTVRVHFEHEALHPAVAMRLASLTLPAAHLPQLPDIHGVALHTISARYGAQPESSGQLATTRPTDPVDPIQPGVSISHVAGAGGTLGLIVTDLSTTSKCLLSCHHVMFGTPTAKKKDVVVQPAHGVSPAANVGRIVRGIRNSEIDAAIARVEGTRGTASAMFGSGDEVRSVELVKLGARVKKAGAVTRETHGIVDGLGVYNIGSSSADQRKILGFRIVPDTTQAGAMAIVSQPGDSGAVWYTSGGNAGVGLHVAGDTRHDSTGEFGIACHLQSVFARLNINF